MSYTLTIVTPTLTGTKWLIPPRWEGDSQQHAAQEFRITLGTLGHCLFFPTKSILFNLDSSSGSMQILSLKNLKTDTVRDYVDQILNRKQWCFCKLQRSHLGFTSCLSNDPQR